MHSVQNSNRFIGLYNQIDKFLATIIGAKNYIPYNEKITIIAEGEYHQTVIIREHQNKLRYFGDLRNQLVHGFSLEKNHYVLASNYAVEQIERLYELLISPKTALEVFGGTVYSCTLSDSLKEVIAIMKNERNTHVPVYDNNGKFIEMLSESTIAYRIADNLQEDFLLDDAVTVGDVKLENSNDTFAFISAEKNIYEVQELFWEASLQKKRLGALFITQDGTAARPIEGIITALDLPKLASVRII